MSLNFLWKANSQQSNRFYGTPKFGALITSEISPGTKWSHISLLKSLVSASYLCPNSLYAVLSSICSINVPSPIRFSARVCGSSLAAIVCSNPAGVHGTLSVLSLERFQVEVSASGRSFIQRSHIIFGVQTVWSRSPVRGCHDPELGQNATGKNILSSLFLLHSFQLPFSIQIFPS